MAPLRRLVKTSAEALLGGSVVARFSNTWLGRHRLILAYHNVVEDSFPEGDHSLHCSFDRFRSHLDTLQARHSITSLEQLLQNETRKPRVALTFDDAYRGALRLALPELAAREVPATVFVSPGLLGRTVTWWDALADGHGLDEEDRVRCLTEFAGSTDRIQEWARAVGRLWRSRTPDLGIASEEELARATARPGVTVGAHSWSHPNLTRVDDAALSAEMSKTATWLEERFPSVTRRWLAYPYGLHDERVERAARAAGYTAGLGISGGWTGPNINLMAIPRLNIPAGLSPNGLSARLSGFLT